MLTQFSVTNFQCIKGKATLDMRSIALSEYKNSLIENRLLPVAAIYGPNGGGKSTLLKAFFTLQTLIARHFNVVGGVKPVSDAPVIGMQIIPFKFDSEYLHKPTEFELFIEIDGIEYKYYLAILNNKIVDESLYFKKVGGKAVKEMFARHNSDIVLGASIKSEVKVGDNIAEGMPVLAWIGMVYKIEQISKIIDWFSSTFSVDYNVPFQDELLLNNILQLELKKDERSAIIKGKTLDLLRRMDLNIASYRAEKIPISPNRFGIKISTKHSIDGASYELDLQEESNGTKKVFGILPLVVVALLEGRTVVIDELDAKMHPQLLKFIIGLFTSKVTNTKGAQLIFTSHDLTTMTKDVFRRDEIWFMAMGEQEYSNFYSLIDIRAEDGQLVRNDAAYNKQYIEGRYGADPYLNAIKHWEV